MQFPVVRPLGGNRALWLLLVALLVAGPAGRGVLSETPASTGRRPFQPVDGACGDEGAWTQVIYPEHPALSLSPPQCQPRPRSVVGVACACLLRWHRRRWLGVNIADTI